MPPKKKLICIEKHKVIYAPVPKVANSSMKSVLAGLVRRNTETKHIPTHQRYWTESTDGDTCLVDPKFALKKAREGWFVFTIVRNPLDRLVSCYNNKIMENPNLPSRMQSLGYRSGMPFTDFVDVLRKTSDRAADNHTVSQAYILSSGNNLAVNYIGKFEAITQDYKTIQERLSERTGAGIPDLPKKNVRRTSGADYMSYYQDPTVLQFVIDRYRRDFEIFYPDVLETLDRSSKSISHSVFQNFGKLFR